MEFTCLMLRNNGLLKSTRGGALAVNGKGKDDGEYVWDCDGDKCVRRKKGSGDDKKKKKEEEEIQEGAFKFKQFIQLQLQAHLIQAPVLLLLFLRMQR